ncbi:hypothetical protein OC844_000359 [Tilletia horrida]|nr:hypothetical protein OC844_000359 [Tilletia horrida]
MPSQRSGFGPASRTYGSKPSAAHRIKRSNVDADWLEAGSSSSSATLPSTDRALPSIDADADPLQLHQQNRSAVALAADSSSSAEGDSPARASTVSPSHEQQVEARPRRVEETPSPSDARVITLQISEDEGDEGGESAEVDFGLGSSSPGRATSRSQPHQQDTNHPSDSEESEFDSPHASQHAKARAKPVPQAAHKRVTRASSHPLSEVLTPLASLQTRSTRQNGNTKSKASSSSREFKRGTSRSRSQSPLLTTNGARPTEALAEVMRRSKRPRKSTYRSEQGNQQDSRSDGKDIEISAASKRPQLAAPSAATPSRSLSSRATSSRATSEADVPAAEPQLAATMDSLRTLALDPRKVPRKSKSLITIDVPIWQGTPDRPTRPRLSRLPDPDPTPRPEIRRLRSSIGQMPSSDPDSLRGVHGSSPVKRRRTDDASSEDSDASSEEYDSDEDTEGDDGMGNSAKEAAALEMSKREHSTVLGPDLKAVDENMTTLLAVCGQNTFIPFSKVLSLLGASPAPAKQKKGKGSKAGAESGTLVKIGEATYSEVFRLTTNVSVRRGRLVKGKGKGKVKAGAGNDASETWEERKVLKIVPIRKDRPAPSERKQILPSAVAATLVKAPAGKSAAAEAEVDEASSRRRGARARVPSQKRVETDTGLSEEQEKARRRKRASERISTGPELSTARDVQREIEVTRALGRLNPDGGAGGAFGSFVKLHAAHIVAGPYPQRLLEAWDDYHEKKEGGSENWRPDVLEDNQVFAVIVLGDGGRNLEHSELQTWQQAASIFWQLVHAIATAEMAIQFEHRDLHWGNVLISPRPPEIEPLRSATLQKRSNALSVLASPRSAARQAPSLVSATSTVHFLKRAAERGRKVLDVDQTRLSTRRSGAADGPAGRRAAATGATGADFSRALEAQNAGIYATIIDFALSRVVLEPGEGLGKDGEEDGFELRQKRILAYDFDDEEIFEGKGDPQFDVYRDMRDLVEGDWHTFRPITNVMWLSFFVEKLTATRKLKQLTFKQGKNYVGDEHRERYFYFFLRHCQRRIHDSVEDVLEAAFDTRDAAAKAKRTGRPIEEFLPKKNAGGHASKGEKGRVADKAAPKPLSSAKALLRWMRREAERLEDGFHAGDV